MSSGPTMLPGAHPLETPPETPPEGTMSFAGPSAAHDDANSGSVQDWDPIQLFELQEEEEEEEEEEADSTAGTDSTPSPLSDKLGMPHPRPPPRYVGTKAAAKLAAVRKQKTTGRSPSSKGSPSPSNVLIPRKEDWEPFKAIIHDLYIVQNMILKKVMVIMERDYNLRATSKMYKSQLGRWKFGKYNVKGRQGDDMSLVTSRSRSSPPSTDGLPSPLLHESGQSRSVQIGLTTVRDFLNRLIRVDPTAKADMVMSGYNDPCFRFFTVSMELLDQGENKLGGLVLRRAFLQSETLMSNMTTKAFSDLCFTIPHLLIECGRVDILTHFLRYLAGLAVLTGNQPMREVVASLTDLCKDPDALIRFVMELTRATSDTITANTDAKSLVRTRKWAHNLYAACQRTCMPGTTAGKGRHNHSLLRVESQSVYWAQNLVMKSPESDALAERWMRRDFPDDFVPRTEALIAEVRALRADGILVPPYDRMMECLYFGWLGDYYEAVEDWPKAFEWIRRGLDVSVGEQYQIWSIHVERLMRKHGSPEEADELMKRRVRHVFLEDVTKDLEELNLESK